MPIRTRSGSSPIRGSTTVEGVSVLITSPSRKSGDGRLRRGSLGAVEAVKQRARRDTTTSSDMSSENEIDATLFKRRQINPRKAAQATNFLAEKHKEDELLQARNLKSPIDENSAEDSDRSSFSAEFPETADTGSLLDEVRDPLNSSPLTQIRPAISLSPDSPRKLRNPPSSMLQALPPPRPISTIQPVSLLGQAIKARQSKPKNPIEAFARLSGKGALDPLYIRIYAPFSEAPTKPFDMPLLKLAPDGGAGEKPQVIVADAIGLSLWRYHEEGLKPPIQGPRLNVNRWTLRMIEDGEVDYDFPALGRTRPIVDFTSNNNRAARGRAREKPYHEFALVEATEAQFKENQTLTPKYEEQVASEKETIKDSSGAQDQKEKKELSSPQRQGFYPSATQKPGFGPAKPPMPTSHSTPRMGPSKLLKIHFTSLEALTQTTTVDVTTDTYIAEVLDIVCKRWTLDKAYHILKVTGTNTVAPVDRTVEALGPRIDLDLVRRRFANEGAIGLAGSPGSSSPNAPLLFLAETPKKGKRNPFFVQPQTQKQDLLTSTTKYKRYNVVRKQTMSFAPSQQRILLMDEDYMHILPGETGKTLFDTSSKTNRIPFSMIVGCKISRRHPKTFRVSLSPFLHLHSSTPPKPPPSLHPPTTLTPTPTFPSTGNNLPRARNQTLRLRSPHRRRRDRDRGRNHPRHGALSDQIQPDLRVGWRGGFRAWVGWGGMGWDGLGLVVGGVLVFE